MNTAVTDSSTDKDTPESTTTGGLPFGKIALAVVAIVGLVGLGRFAGGYIPAFAEWVNSLGIWGPVVFIVGYAVAVVAFVPASALTLGAGAIFGLVKGVALVFAGATLGACLSFLVSRNLAREAVQKRVEGDKRFEAIDKAVADDGRRIVFLLRLSPVFPFNLLNYALGLTKVKFADYALASVGMLPGTLLYVYLGYVGGGIAAAAGESGGDHTAATYGVQALGLAATIAVTVVVTRTARKALAEATDKDLAG